MEYVSCRGFSVLPESSFHPVRYNKVKEFFAQPMVNETEEKSISWLTEKVVGVHTWNKLSKDEPIYKNATHAYIQLARNNCPHIFSIAPEIF
jgi:lactosylceramide 4-alpha-galactosyltransferase